MRILVVGAGAVGGYFGGRLLQAGRDVTFLVRPARAEQLARHGLKLVSQHGSATLHPPVVLSSQIDLPFDLVLLGVKAYSLPAAIEDVAAAIGPSCTILPFLNGMSHIASLEKRFGRAVVGGVCLVSTDLGDQGEILQLNETQRLIYGELNGTRSRRIEAVDEALQGAGFPTQISERILAEMWEKWVFLATLGATNCLLRGNVGEIEAVPGGRETAVSIFQECIEVAAACGFRPSEEWTRKRQDRLTARGSTLTSSMARDLAKGRPVEVEQILGDLLREGTEHGVATPLLQAACVQLRVYSAGIRG